VKLGTDRTLQPPPEPIGEPNEERTASSEETLRKARDRQDRYGDQHVLDDKEGQRGGEDPIHRPQQRQDRVEVITQQVVAGPFDGDDGCLEARIRLDSLGEDAQVPRGGGKRAPLRHRVTDVERADCAGDEGGRPPGRHQATDGQSIRTLHPTISAGCASEGADSSAWSRAEAGAG